MQDWWSRAFVLTMLVVVIGVPLLFRPADEGAPADDAGGRLVIFTPHNEQIRYEFARGFNAWRKRQGQPPIEFDFRASGGTSDLRRIVVDQFRNAAKDGRADRGIGADLFFGGGPYDHDKMAEGVRVERNGEQVTEMIAEPPSLPDALWAEVYPTHDIGGAVLFHPQRRWVGTALSSFGIVYNRDVLNLLEIDEPTTWSDLTDPRLRGWVGVADPSHSGSATTTYDAILRRLGWVEGWRVLRRMFANARYFASMASKVPVDVTNGEVGAGVCIDFYGRFQAGAIRAAGRGEGPGRIGYVDPPFMTAISADPITLFRGAPNRDTAVQFISWLLSKDAQRLWQRRVGVEGGPDRYELRRLSIRRDLYTPEETALWRDSQANPFAIAKPFAPGMPIFFSTIETVSQAMAIDVRDDLVAAWEAIQRSPDHPRRDEMLALFDRMPDALAIPWPDAQLAEDWMTILEDEGHARHAEVAQVLNNFRRGITDRWRADRDHKIADRLEWTRFFQANYRRIVEIADSP